MIVSHKHRFIFLKTHKTGGTSIEFALRALCGDDDIIAPVIEDRKNHLGRGPQNYLRPWREMPFWDRVKLIALANKKLRESRRVSQYVDHMSASEIRDQIGEKVWSSYFKFSVERNPWDRHVSLYFWRHGRLPRPTLREFTNENSRLDNWSIYTIGDQVVADHIIRYERDLTDGLTKALGLIGISAPALGHAKAKKRPADRAGYRSMFDDHTRSIIARWYEREIDYFGWEF